MSKNVTTNRKQLINKTNSSIVVIVGITCFVVVFSLIAGRALLSQRAYQAKLISKKETARNTLLKNIDTVESIKKSYQVFTSSPENVIGGISTGTGDRDGDNAKIILDALPSKYDFPALATSINKIFKGPNFTLVSSTGQDDELAQGQVKTEISPQPVAIPVSLTLSANNAQGIQDIFSIIERSIRPINVKNIKISAAQGEGSTSISITSETFFQPGKSLDIPKETVK